MTQIVNGLAATPTRRALLRLIAAGGGRIYGEANQVWDKLLYRRVTDSVRTFIQHGWVRALAPDEERAPGERGKNRTFYRLTDLGEVAMRGGA